MTISDFIRMNGIHVIMHDMPTTVRGFVITDKQDSPTIFINSRMSREVQREALKHEINHILNNDLWNESYVEY